jgi:hypothetical protein
VGVGPVGPVIWGSGVGVGINAKSFNDRVQLGEMTFALLLLAAASIATFDSSFAAWAWQRIARVAFKVNPIIRTVPILKTDSIIEGASSIF